VKSEGWQRGSIEIAQGEVVLIEAQEVSELMEVSGADFLGKGSRIPFGQIPKVPQVKDDAGRGVSGNGIGFQSVGTFKQAEQIGFESLLQDLRVRGILIEGEDGFRGGAQLLGETGADVLHGFSG